MTEVIWLVSKQVAPMLGISHRTLERWRSTGYGPPFHKPGRKILYSKSEVEEWLAGKRYRSTSEFPGGSHSMGWIGLLAVGPS